MKCYHMSGAGNDFMVIDARGQNLDFKRLTLQLCPKTHADGFMAVGLSDKADFRLHFYNSDGTRGEMCGNGARCICKFAYDQGIAGESMSVETDAGIVYGWRLDENQYRVQLNNPGILDPHRREDAAYVELGTPGVPHGVVELPGLTWDMREDLRDRAKALRYDPAFPKGANINFYTWLGDDEVRMLTYERGVEDYTLACGTGCGSTAAALWTAGRLPGGKLICHHPGGTLTVTLSGENGLVTKLFLEGPAVVLNTYEIPVPRKKSPHKKKKLNPRFLLLVGVVAILAALLIGLLVVATRLDPPSAEEPTESTLAPTSPSQTVPNITASLPHMIQLQLDNPQIVMQISLPDGSFNAPIALEEANSAHLSALISDCSLEPESTNLVIRDSSLRLRQLTKYQNEAFWQKYPVLALSTLSEHRSYEIVAVKYPVDTADAMALAQSFASEEQFDKSMEELAETALYETGVTAVFGDRLLILSIDSQRGSSLLLVAKLQPE